MNENKIIKKIELHGTRDLTKLSFIKASGRIKNISNQEIVPRTNIIHEFYINGKQLPIQEDDVTVHFVVEAELNRGINSFTYQNSDNMGWRVSLSVGEKEVFISKHTTQFQAKVRVGNFAIIPIPQINKRIKSKTKAKITGLQIFGGGLLRRIQNIGKNSQVLDNAEKIDFEGEVLPQKNVPYDFSEEAKEGRQKKKLSLFG